MQDKKVKKDQEIIKHLGIIVSGSRAWARARNLPIAEGYKKTFSKILPISKIFFKYKIENLSFLIFTNEQWKQFEQETSFLLQAFNRWMTSILESEEKEELDYKIIFSGNTQELPIAISENILKIKNLTKHFGPHTINLGINYDGQDEIVESVLKIQNKKLDQKQIHKGMIRKYLYNGDLCDVDAIVNLSSRTQSQGFLMWQSMDARQIVLRKFWPDLEKVDVIKILQEYYASDY